MTLRTHPGWVWAQSHLGRSSEWWLIITHPLPVAFDQGMFPATRKMYLWHDEYTAGDCLLQLFVVSFHQGYTVPKL